MDKQTVVFIGRSGCGKGTQAKNLISYIEKNDDKNALYIATGALFRDFIKGDRHTQELSKARYDTSKLQPTFLSTYLWGKFLVENETGNEHFIFDGLPRTRSESKILSSVFDFYGRENPTIVYLDVSEKWSRERLKSRGREDDLDDSEVETRIEWFQRDVLPAIEYYRGNDAERLVEINGEQSIEKVHQDIIKALNI